MKIKICGLKSIEDCQIACEAGAHMLGFNFYKPSPRYIAIDACREIIRKIKATYPEIRCVGVFVNHSLDQVETIMAETGLDLAQLAGDETPADLEHLGVLAFKSLRPVSRLEATSVIQALPTRKHPPAFLLDNYKKGVYGGTGSTGNWKLAAEMSKAYPILLAGGLNPNNVPAAIRAVQPWGVDVASGVESSRGEKDPGKIKDFIQRARAASFEISTE